MSQIDLSVVIVSHNVQGLLRGCLESLLRQCQGLRAEVFVVDSASTDGTVEMVRREFPDVRLIASRENLGFSAGNNAALRLCTGQYVLLLNPDTLVHEGSLHGLMRYLQEHPRAGAAGPALRLADGSIQLEAARNLPTLGRVVPWLLLLDKLQWKVLHRQRRRPVKRSPPAGWLLDRYCLFFWSRDAACEAEAIGGACMMLRREVVDQVGLLDESVPLYLDDMDYCRRTRDAGWQVHYVPTATITHLSQQSTSQLRRAGDIYAMQCHALWVYLRKHQSGLAALAFAAVAAGAAMARVLVWLIPSLLPLGGVRQQALRRLCMGLGLARWALRWPKRAPRMGFACEGPQAAVARTVSDENPVCL